MEKGRANLVEEKIEIGQAQVAVIGVGGGGSNAVNRMYRNRIPHIEYYAVNTDAQALSNSDVPHKLRVGDRLARGMGVGGNPEKGRLCHEEDREHILEMVNGKDMVFIAAGMGGGTGTGGAPVVANVAKDAGALTVGVVTKPFTFEGNQRIKQAEEGIIRLEQECDTLITVPNDRLLLATETNISMDMAFRRADDVLRQGVQSIAELILIPGEINLDFADVTAIMKNAGPAWMAIGTGKGQDKAIEAAEMAISSPLLEQTIDGAKGVLFNITGGSDLSINEIEQASKTISSVVDPDANIIFGTVTDQKMENEMRITLIGTGFPITDKPTPRMSETKEPFSGPSPSSNTQKKSAGTDDLDIPPFLRK